MLHNEDVYRENRSDINTVETRVDHTVEHKFQSISKLFIPQVILPQLFFYFSNHSSNSIHNLGTQNQKTKTKTTKKTIASVLEPIYNLAHTKRQTDRQTDTPPRHTPIRKLDIPTQHSHT